MRFALTLTNMLFVLCLTLLNLEHVQADSSGEIQFDCAKDQPKIEPVSRAQVYRNVPFSQGELARYELRYSVLRTLVGYGTLEVRNPVNYGGAWHQSFHAEGKTGEWYRMFFVAHDKLHALARPQDFAVSQFFMEQDEGKLFGNRLLRKRWLDFDHKNCRVSVKTVEQGKPEKLDEHDVAPGAIDALSAVFKLRTFDYKVGAKQRALIYTSEKNWWLEAEPLNLEPYKIGDKTYQAMKIKLQTFLGDQLQQRGDVYIWIAVDHPNRPLVKLEGVVKIGTINLELVEFKPGN